MKQKIIIFDASTLISFSMNGLVSVLGDLKKIFKGKFIITDDVKYEVIDKPIRIKRFSLEALRVKQLLNEGILEMPDSLGIENKDIVQFMNEAKHIANSMFMARGKDIEILHSGESSCLGLSKILNKKGIENVIAVDERTLRMLGEKPESVKKLLERKLHTQIKSNKQNSKFFEGFKFIRSTELVYVAYKKGFIKLKGPEVLDALLYALKFKGCSISDDEIREIKSLAKK